MVALAEQSGSSGITHGTGVGSGPPPALREILEQTEFIMRGIIGEQRSYLSDDQKHVQTDLATPFDSDSPSCHASLWRTRGDASPQ